MKDWIRAFKARHIKHRFFYKLYRIAKFNPWTAYAAFGEDMLVHRIYTTREYRKNPHIGTYVDVGCNHPVIGNTTYKMYKEGWRGLNIDLTAENIKLCQRIRKRDISVQCAITDQHGEIESYIFDPGSGLNTLDKEAADHGVEITGKPYTIEKIKAAPLNDVITEHLGRKKIDVLNVDVEGHEMAVLASFDFETFSPDIITCEIHGKAIEEIQETDVYQLITKNGYHCFSYSGYTALFARNVWDYRI